MKPYILSLVAAALAAAVVELLAPRGEGGRITAQVRMVAGLFLLVALLLPLRDGVAFLSELADGEGPSIPSYDAPDYEATLQAAVLSMGSAELTAWVTSTLAETFSVPPEQVEVVPVWAEGETVPPPLTEVCIVLSGKAALTDPHPIEAFFADVLGCPCRVSVSFSYQKEAI